MKYINIIGKMVEQGIREKSHFLPMLVEADKEILQFSNDMNFIYEEPMNLFYQTTDERLFASLNKQKKASEKPEITIQECVKGKLALLDNFIKKYHIGFIRSAKIEKNGYVSVEIPCSIHSSFVSDDRESAKATFNAQIDFLKEIGLEIMETKYFDLKIIRTENNMKILEEIFKSRGCNQIRFSIIDNFIDKIKFNFNINNIYKFDEIPISILLDIDPEILNEDETGKVLKYVKEILSAKSNVFLIDNNIKNTCCSLIESYFSYICKVFNYEGEICKRVNSRYETERNKNIEINSIEKNIENNISVDEFKNILTSCREKINKFTIENLSFQVSDFYIDRYGFVCYTLHFANSNWLNEYQLASEEDLRKNFKMSLGNRNDETLAMLDTYENKERLLQILKNFCPTSRIADIKCGVKDNYFCINEIRVVIDNIASIM